MSRHNFSLLSIEEIFRILDTNKDGLTEDTVKIRLKHHGLNKLPEEKKIPRFFLLLSQFKNSLVYILLGASVISFFLQDFVDMGVILAAVLINVIVGFIQEYKACKAIEKLKKVITLLARVKRNGQEKEIKAEELVPGDIVILKAGDKVPADGRLIFSKDLEVNEASLTGESLPVKKDTIELKQEKVLAERSNIVFLGTIVVQGTAEIVITATGLDTELGKIANLIKETPEEKTPFQKKLDHLSRIMGFIAIGISLAIFVIGILEQFPFIQIFPTSVAIAVSAIPEGLVIAVTAILALGMQTILKQKALVKKLIAAETLGSTTVICTDKTGTLTQGQMHIAQIVTLNHDFAYSYDHTKNYKIKEEAELAHLLKIGVLCNDAIIENLKDEFHLWKLIGNPTEQAILKLGAELGFYREQFEKEEPRIDELPFDSDNKFMLTLHHQKNNNIVYLKGAPESILKMSKLIQVGLATKPLDDSLRNKFEKEFEEMSALGLRMLAFGYQIIDAKINSISNSPNLADLLDDFIFVGLVGIKDPLRKESKETIKLCQQAGINVVMITGDHKLTAQAIAKELGLKSNPENILEGQELQKMSSQELVKRVKDISVYARVTPKDKLTIVDAWQEKGEVVAMTGDGVNDAPALKSADIGVALGSGSDVAKETADLVILDDNFKTLVAAVEQGRIIFDNIKKVILYLLSDSFTEVLIITGAIIISGLWFKDFPLPLFASQILWVNLVNDSIPSIALTFEPGEKEIMAESPAGRKRSIFSKEMTVLIILISVVSGLGNLFLFWFLIEHGWAVDTARTIIFSNISIDSLFYIFSIQSLRRSIFSKKIISNHFLLNAVALSLLLQLAAIYFPPLQKVLATVPLPGSDWLIIGGACLFVLLLVEITKSFFISKKIRGFN